jgi:hypothetical protein
LEGIGAGTEKRAVSGILQKTKKEKQAKAGIEKYVLYRLKSIV